MEELGPGKQGPVQGNGIPDGAQATAAVRTANVPDICQKYGT